MEAILGILHDYTSVLKEWKMLRNLKRIVYPPLYNAGSLGFKRSSLKFMYIIQKNPL